MKKIETPFSKMFGIDYPIIAAPMFLVSNEKIVTAVSDSGGIGTFPSLNYRTSELYKKALLKMREGTQKPIGVNIIVNKSNPRQSDDLKIALDLGVELIITSLGSPESLIKDAHKNGTKVFCDVTNLTHAKKVQDLGADGVIAVSSGAGGHAGPISPIVLIPWLKEEIKIPIIAAGGIASGGGLAAMLLLGADGVSVGTRFIATSESEVSIDYKNAIVKATPEDILLTDKLSGTPASVISTPYVQKMGQLSFVSKYLKNNPTTKRYVVPFLHLTGMKLLEESAKGATWKNVWGAGQSVGVIHEIKSCREVIEDFAKEYFEKVEGLPK